MESGSAWEHKMLTDELAQGMEKAMQLRLQLCSTSPSEAEDLLLQRIISTFEKALYALKWNGQAQVGPTASAAPESSISVDGSPRSDDVSKNFKDHSGCSKLLGDKASAKIGRRPYHLRVNTEDLEIQHMPAHFSFPSALASQDAENNCSPISALADDNHMGTHSPFFYPPATSESNYFSAASYQMRDYAGVPVQHLETDIADIISAHTSTTNSPIGGMEFSVDPVDLDPNFPFNMPDFFT